MSTARDPNEAAAAWYARYRDLRLKLALLVGAIALVVAMIVFVGKNLLSINPGPGTPIGHAVRTDGHIAVLIQTLEAYIPSPNRDHSKDTYAISLFILPLDGSKPQLVKLKEGMRPNAFSLAKVIGSDGRALWFDAAGVGAVDLSTFKLLPPAELRDPPEPKRTNALPFGPKVEDHLAAGLFTSPTTWLGLLSAEEATRDLKPGFSLKRVRDAVSAKQQRGFHRCTLSPEPGVMGHPILTTEPMGDTAYFNAAFLRPHDAAEPLRLRDPDSALMVYTSAPGLKGTTILARVDLEGKVLWRTDTGIDRFALQQILPGEGSTAFYGTRPPEEDKVPEPLLVIVEHGTGTMRTESLWR
ncbi:MAG: hypothetical protein KIT10_04815 [Flavobacteriales bacterium]|nr:hypothetical protein [Flavobacteriales bacterium]